MAVSYRKSVLDKISNPEQLNKAFVITSPLSWLALVGITVIIVITLLWSVWGWIPETVTINGKIVSATGSTNAIYTSDGGIVQQVYVSVGSSIQRGDPVIRLSVNGESKDVPSDQTGTVTKTNVQIGNTITSGKPIVYISPILQSAASQVAVCYASSSVNSDDAGKIELGMQATISMPSADSLSSGHMTGYVINIDRYTTSADSMAELFSDNQVAVDINKEGAVKAVVIELTESEHHSEDAKNDFIWSNHKGSKLTVNNGDSITVRVITRQVRPIEKLFKKIGEIIGGDQ